MTPKCVLWQIMKNQMEFHIMWHFGSVYTFAKIKMIFSDRNSNAYSKTCVKRPLKNRQNKDLNDKCWLNEGQKYCRMLPLEHSAIVLTCIK